MLNFQAEHTRAMPGGDYLRIDVYLPQSEERWSGAIKLSGDDDKDGVALAALFRQMADKLDPSRFDAKLAEAKQALGVV